MGQQGEVVADVGKAGIRHGGRAPAEGGQEVQASAVSPVLLCASSYPKGCYELVERHGTTLTFKTGTACSACWHSTIAAGSS